MNIALFANTGIGNTVLMSLLNAGENVKVVVTRKLEGLFPYYEEKELFTLCEENSIDCLTNININGSTVINKLKTLEIDLIIVSSFNQIIKDEVINLPNYGIVNFHPSLLPSYRGPNPLNWVLLNSENVTGVTIHKLVKEVDAGDILLQRVVYIEPYQNLGSLFEATSKCAGEMIPELLKLYYSNKIDGIKQNETNASYYKKPFSKNLGNIKTNIKEFICRLRAFTPYPGFNFQTDNLTYRVIDFQITKEINNQDGLKNLNIQNGCITYKNSGYTINMRYDSYE